LSPRLSLSPEFDRLASGCAQVSLSRVALEIACDHQPRLNIDGYLERIGQLCDRVRARIAPGATLRAALGQIDWVLSTEEGFEADFDWAEGHRQCHLNDLLDERVSTPVNLAILYREIGRDLGLDLEFANVPSLLYLRVIDQGRLLVVSPTSRSKLPAALSGLRHYVRDVTEVRPSAIFPRGREPCPLRLVVVRLLGELRVLKMRHEGPAAVLPIQRRIVRLRPRSWLEQSNLGVFYHKLGRLGPAVDAFEAALALAPPLDRARALARKIEDLRAELAELN